MTKLLVIVPAVLVMLYYIDQLAVILSKANTAISATVLF